MFKPKKDKYEVQENIILKQNKLISDLQEKLETLQSEMELSNTLDEKDTNLVKSFMNDIELYRTILDDCIARARKAERAYKDMLKEVEPLKHEYEKQLKELNKAIEVTRLHIK
ncbi:MAG TPA: hypothetical protein DCW90_11150 [Lachnospiraceae bacterium]|nr:hypothetical protein [Lachnospiraceae bacterium]